MTKLILKSWSNSYGNTVDELKKCGNKIIAVSKSGEQGHIITFKHKTLTSKPRRGDLVEYYDDSDSERSFASPSGLKRAIVKGTEKDWWCLTDCVGIKNTIISIGNITRIIKKQLISNKIFRYLED